MNINDKKLKLDNFVRREAEISTGLFTANNLKLGLQVDEMKA